MPEDQYAPVDEGVDHVQGIVALLWTPSPAQVWISTPQGLRPPRSAGYPTVIAHGMLQAALPATYATGLLGAATVPRFGVRFRSQVFYGDTLDCSGTVVVEEGPRAAWPPSNWSEAAHRRVVITGTADFFLA